MKKRDNQGTQYYYYSKDSLKPEETSCQLDSSEKISKT